LKLSGSVQRRGQRRDLKLSGGVMRSNIPQDLTWGRGRSISQVNIHIQATRLAYLKYFRSGLRNTVQIFK